MRRFLVLVVLVVAANASSASQDLSASNGWVEGPRDGESSARAFVSVKNPTMYDVYLVKAASDACDKVEFRRSATEDATSVPELTVPAYGSVSMGPEGVHLVLIDLKRELEKDETVSLTLTTDAGAKLQVKAVVRAE